MATQTAQISEKYATLSHGRTRYFEAGSGYPTLLLHGAAFDHGADNWLANLPSLASSLRVLAPDSLNWGPGDIFDAEFSFAYQVDHIRELMDALGIGRANLVGHSMGGWLATLLAYESRERVNKLVLVAAGGTATRPLANMVEWQPPSVEQVTQRVSARLAEQPPEVREQLVQQYVAKTQDAAQTAAFAKVMRHMTNPLTRQRYNTLRRLPFITAPTLILWGRNDQVNDISMGEALHAGIKGSKLVVLEDTGHGLPQERPAEFAKELLAFL
jgi:pimeloyl-ACP methyl ester carboxylesterase